MVKLTIVSLLRKESTEYCVTATLNSCLDTACTMVYLELECGDVFIPNAFSLMEDSNNDLQCVLGNCIESMNFLAAIYNRWGEKYLSQLHKIHAGMEHTRVNHVIMEYMFIVLKLP